MSAPVDPKEDPATKDLPSPDYPTYEPRKAKSAYMFFKSSLYDELHGDGRWPTKSEYASITKNRWEELSNRDRKPFERSEAEDRKRYKAHKASFDKYWSTRDLKAAIEAGVLSFLKKLGLFTDSPIQYRKRRAEQEASRHESTTSAQDTVDSSTKDLPYPYNPLFEPPLRGKTAYQLFKSNLSQEAHKVFNYPSPTAFAALAKEKWNKLSSDEKMLYEKREEDEAKRLKKQQVAWILYWSTRDYSAAWQAKYTKPFPSSFEDIRDRIYSVAHWDDSDSESTTSSRSDASSSLPSLTPSRSPTPPQQYTRRKRLALKAPPVRAASSGSTDASQDTESDSSSEVALLTLSKKKRSGPLKLKKRQARLTSDMESITKQLTAPSSSSRRVSESYAFPAASVSPVMLRPARRRVSAFVASPRNSPSTSGSLENATSTRQDSDSSITALDDDAIASPDDVSASDHPVHLPSPPAAASPHSDEPRTDSPTLDESNQRTYFTFPPPRRLSSRPAFLTLPITSSSPLSSEPTTLTHVAPSERWKTPSFSSASSSRASVPRSPTLSRIPVEATSSSFHLKTTSRCLYPSSSSLAPDSKKDQTEDSCPDGVFDSEGSTSPPAMHHRAGFLSTSSSSASLAGSSDTLSSFRDVREWFHTELKSAQARVVEQRTQAREAEAALAAAVEYYALLSQRLDSLRSSGSRSDGSKDWLSGEAASASKRVEEAKSRVKDAETDLRAQLKYRDLISSRRAELGQGEKRKGQTEEFTDELAEGQTNKRSRLV